MLHESIHRCIIFFSKPQLNKKKTIWEKKKMWDFKTKNQSNNSPPSNSPSWGGCFFDPIRGATLQVAASWKPSLKAK